MGPRHGIVRKKAPAKEPTGRGGARPGAGRPPIGDCRMARITVRLPQALIDLMGAKAQAVKISRSELIRDVLAQWAKS